MILLLGATGYVGRAFADLLTQKQLPYHAPGHAELDASSKDLVATVVRAIKPRLVINAIGFTGRPNIDGTERERLRCLRENTVVPGVLAEVLADAGIRWGHVSSGCIYDGVRSDGLPYEEDDPPNFAFSNPLAGWYSRTKAMAETMLRGAPGCLIWRMRIPFDEFDNERNYITKLMQYDRLIQVRGSISQRQEFVRAAVESLQLGVPDGIYNITNPGAISTSEVIDGILRHGLSNKTFSYFSGELEFLSAPGRVKRANCELSSRKIAAAGIPLREVHEAMEWTLDHWQRQ